MDIIRPGVLLNLVCNYKIHSLSGLSNWHLLLTIMEAEKFEIKIVNNSALGELSLPGLQWMPSYCVLALQGQRKTIKKRDSSQWLWFLV